MIHSSGLVFMKMLRCEKKLFLCVLLGLNFFVKSFQQVNFKEQIECQRTTFSSCLLQDITGFSPYLIVIQKFVS